MDPNDLLKPHLNLLKFGGIKLQYDDNWKDRALKYISKAFFVNFSIMLICQLYFIIDSNRSLEIIVEPIATTSSTWELMLNWLTIYLQGSSIMELLCKLKDLLFEGIDEF
jgi:hypothetical protein